MKAPKEKRIIEIDITNACVHKCSNCTRFCGFHKKPYFMDFDYFCKAVDSLVDRDGVIGIMGGEPTLHPRFEDMCHYLQEKLPKYRLPDTSYYKYPMDNYIEAVYRQMIVSSDIAKWGEHEVFESMGACLLTSITPQYWKHLETIMDTFTAQLLNTHDSVSYHQPILISRKELGIPDDEWIALREKCWLNCRWSGSITPKGVFFCEVAGTLDMLMNGPGGHPIEPGWWKKGIEEYEDQLHWCEMCGLALITPSRNANDEVTDISEEILSQLKKNDSIDLNRNKINAVHIENGQITNIENKEYHGADYLTDSTQRHIPVNVNRIIGVLVVEEEDKRDDELARQASLILDEVYVFVNGELKYKYGKGLRIEAKDVSEEDVHNFSGLSKILKRDDWIVFFERGIRIRDGFNSLRNYVINPGMLYYSNFAKGKKKKNSYVVAVDESIDNGALRCMMVNMAGSSLRRVGDFEIKPLLFEKCVRGWKKDKRAKLSDSMNVWITGGSVTKERLRNARIYLRTFVKKQGIHKLISFQFDKLKRRGLKGYLDAKKSMWHQGL